MAIRMKDFKKAQSEKHNLSFNEAFERGRITIPETMSSNDFQVNMMMIISCYHNSSQVELEMSIRELAELVIEKVYAKVIWYCKPCKELDMFIGDRENQIQTQEKVLRKFVESRVQNKK